jgi:hypothetical protein
LKHEHMKPTAFPRLVWMTVIVAVVNFPLLGCSQSTEPPTEAAPRYKPHPPSKKTPNGPLIDPNPVPHSSLPDKTVVGVQRPIALLTEASCISRLSGAELWYV